MVAATGSSSSSWFRRSVCAVIGRLSSARIGPKTVERSLEKHLTIVRGSTDETMVGQRNGRRMSSKRSERRKRRQWGSDRRANPMPVVAPPVSDRRIMVGRMAIVLTVSAWFTYVVLTIIQQFVEGEASSARLVIEAHRLPAGRHCADRVGDGVPHHPHRLLLPQPGAPPGAPRRDRPLLRPRPSRP